MQTFIQTHVRSPAGKVKLPLFWLRIFAHWLTQMLHTKQVRQGANLQPPKNLERFSSIHANSEAEFSEYLQPGRGFPKERWKFLKILMYEQMRPKSLSLAALTGSQSEACLMWVQAHIAVFKEGKSVTSASRYISPDPQYLPTNHLPATTISP